MGEVGKDSPVPFLVGLGECGARSTAATDADMIELLPHRTEAGFDVAQTFAVSELCECHDQILVPATEALEVTLAMIAGNAFLELLVRGVSHQLCKDRLAGVHSSLSRASRVEPGPGASPAKLQIVPTVKWS